MRQDNTIPKEMLAGSVMEVIRDRDFRELKPYNSSFLFSANAWLIWSTTHDTIFLQCACKICLTFTYTYIIVYGLINNINIATDYICTKYCP